MNFRRSEAHAGNSLEAVIVTAGRLDIDVDGSGLTAVSAGQSMMFAAHRSDEYRDTTDRAAASSLAVFDPSDHATRH